MVWVPHASPGSELRGAGRAGASEALREDPSECVSYQSSDGFLCFVFVVNSCIYWLFIEQPLSSKRG